MHMGMDLLEACHRFLQSRITTLGYRRAHMIKKRSLFVSAVLFCVAALLLGAVLSEAAPHLTAEGTPCEKLHTVFSALALSYLHQMHHDSFVRVHLSLWAHTASRACEQLRKHCESNARIVVETSPVTPSVPWAYPSNRSGGDIAAPITVLNVQAFMMCDDAYASCALLSHTRC
jgi:hypothetical protein